MLALLLLSIVPCDPTYIEDRVYSVELSHVYIETPPLPNGSNVRLLDEPKYIFRDPVGSRLEITDVRFSSLCGRVAKDRAGWYLAWMEDGVPRRVRFREYGETHELTFDPDIYEREYLALEDRRGLFGELPFDVYDYCGDCGCCCWLWRRGLRKR